MYFTDKVPKIPRDMKLKLDRCQRKPTCPGHFHFRLADPLQNLTSSRLTAGFSPYRYCLCRGSVPRDQHLSMVIVVALHIEHSYPRRRTRLPMITKGER